PRWWDSPLRGCGPPYERTRVGRDRTAPSLYSCHAPAPTIGGDASTHLAAALLQRPDAVRGRDRGRARRAGDRAGSRWGAAAVAEAARRGHGVRAMAGTAERGGAVLAARHARSRRPRGRIRACVVRQRAGDRPRRAGDLQAGPGAFP